MSRIKLRVMGLYDDVQVIANWFADMPQTVSVSNLYANRPPSKECRCYIEMDIESPAERPQPRKRIVNDHQMRMQ